VTRSGPTRLAFTGGEPILIAAFGIMLMISGAALHARRRRSH
jgi:LPXTG-motif cell wall-anchored protein